MVRFTKRVLPLGAVAFAAIGTSLIAADARAASPLPPYVHPTHFASVESPMQPEAAAASGTCGLEYNGGAVIARPEAVVVYWGAVSDFAKQNAPTITKEVVSSAYMDQLSEYNTSSQKIVRGGYVGAYQITPSITSKTIDNSQIGPELQKQIDAGNLPKPTFDSAGHSNSLFVLLFAPGISITLKDGGQTATSCVQFCGYHYGWAFTETKKPVRYAVVPDMGKTSMCSQGCGFSEIEAYGDTISHEIAEAVTDPDSWNLNIGWYDTQSGLNCGENGDICAPGTGQGAGAGDGALDGVRVQKLWSQKNQTCQLSDPAVAVQAGCAANGDCPAVLPICDPTSKSCVGCEASSDCSGARPVCDPKLKVCSPCAASSDCTAPTAICVTNAVSGGPAAGTCVECLQNPDCPGTKPVCTANACTGCTADTDCADPANPTCNTASGACGPTPPPAASSSGGNNDNGGGTGSSGGCAVSDGPSGGAFGFGGLLFGLAALVRARRARARR